MTQSLWTFAGGLADRLYQWGGEPWGQGAEEDEVNIFYTLEILKKTLKKIQKRQAEQFDNKHNNCVI